MFQQKAFSKMVAVSENAFSWKMVAKPTYVSANHFSAKGKSKSKMVFQQN
jgi:hypothetical protein